MSPNSLKRMHKAIAVIQFKLEGQIIRRHPEYDMSKTACCLNKIDFDQKNRQDRNKNLYR